MLGNLEEHDMHRSQLQAGLSVQLLMQYDLIKC